MLVTSCKKKTISSGSLEKDLTKLSLSAHIYLQSAAHVLPHPGSVAYSPLPWSGYCKITCKCSCCLAISIIAIHFRLVLWTMTSPNCNAFRINWPVLWQSCFHLVTVFHCFIPFIGYQQNLELISRSVADPRNSLWKAASFLSVHACPITPILFTEIEQRKHSVSPEGQG